MSYFRILLANNGMWKLMISHMINRIENFVIISQHFV